jgi:hypothetical protein
LYVRFFFMYWHCGTKPNYGDQSSRNLESGTRLKTIHCAAAGVASQKHRSEACTMYGRYGNMSDKTGNVCIM